MHHVYICHLPYAHDQISQGYYHPTTAQLVHNHFDIAVHYLKGWFLLDALSSIPVELCEITGMVDGSELGTLKIVRTLKLFRLVRLMKIPAFEAMMEDHDLLSPSMIRLLKLIITYLLILHWIGCAVWGLASTEHVVGTPWDQLTVFAQQIQSGSKPLDTMLFYEAYFNAFLVRAI